MLVIKLTRNLTLYDPDERIRYIMFTKISFFFRFPMIDELGIDKPVYDFVSNYKGLRKHSK